jgi:hypothetical protein
MNYFSSASALMIVIVVTATIIVSASTSNNGLIELKKEIDQSKWNKIDDNLKDLISSQSSDVSLPVIIVLKEQPAHDISKKVKKEYKKDLEDITEPAAKIYSRIRPLMGGEEALKIKNISDSCP